MSIRTVFFALLELPHETRSPSPERIANSSCVSPAALRFSLINFAIGFISAPPFCYIFYTRSGILSMGLAWIYTRSVVNLCVCYSIAP